MQIPSWEPPSQQADRWRSCGNFGNDLKGPTLLSPGNIAQQTYRWQSCGNFGNNEGTYCVVHWKPCSTCGLLGKLWLLWQRFEGTYSVVPWEPCPRGESLAKLWQLWQRYEGTYSVVPWEPCSTEDRWQSCGNFGIDEGTYCVVPWEPCSTSG